MIILILIVLVVLLSSLSIVSNDALKKIYQDWKPSIDSASLKFNVPKERIIAIIAQESHGDPNAKGLTNDVGLMQITPPALTDFNRVYARSYGVNALLDPGINIEVGTGYLAWLRAQVNGDLDIATRAYNVGLGTILQSRDAGSSYLASVLKYQSQVSLT